MDEEFESARRLHESGRLEEAAAAYRRVPSNDDRYVRSLNNLGVVLEELGRRDEAIDSYRKGLEQDPDSAELHYNLGHAHHSEGRLDEAILSYVRAISARSDFVEALHNLGLAYLATERLEQAEFTFRRVLTIAPDSASALGHLGEILYRCSHLGDSLECFEQAVKLESDEPSRHFDVAKALDGLGRLDEAAVAYRKCIDLNPSSDVAYDGLADILRRAGKKQESIAVLKQWLRNKPASPLAAHLLDAGIGNGDRARAPDAYVKTLFDGFANDFDATLAKLGYRVPNLIAKALHSLYPAPEARLRVLDAGCGTGLCGRLLRPHADRLVGVDLSPGMLERAKARGTYDELVEGELTDVLSHRPAEFDLIVAADTLVYFGDLQPFLDAVASAFRNEGTLIFTLEKLDGPTPTRGYRLTGTGRYAHTEKYMSGLLGGCGFRIVAKDEVTLRSEGGTRVVGLVVSAKFSKSNQSNP